MYRKSNVRKITKLKRSVNAISPVIATLLMIAIAVVASLVAYAWVTGYIGGTTTKAGKAISLPSFASSTGTTAGPLVVYVQNVGQGAVELKPEGSVYVDDVLYSITDPTTNPISIPEGQTVALTIGGYTYTPGATIKIKVVTSEGVFMESRGRSSGGSQGGPQPVPALTTFAIANIGSQQVNTAFDVVVTAKDQSGATFNLNGAVGLTDTTGTLTPNSVTLTNGVGTATVTIATGANPVTITATSGSVSGTSNQFQVSSNPPALDHFGFSTITNQITGSPFSITITAKDQYDNDFAGYTGTNSLTYSAGTVSPVSTGAFVAGVWTGTVTVTGTGSGVTISTTNGAQSGTSLPFDVNTPAPVLSTFSFSTIPSQIAGTAFTVTITAQDQYGATFSSFTGTVDLVANSGTTSIPMTPAISDSFVAGVWTGTDEITINQAAADVVITAARTGGTETGDSNPFVVSNAPAVLDGFTFDTISSPQATGNAFSITIRAIDQYDQPFTSYTGTNTLSYSAGTISPTGTTVFTGGVWTSSVTVTGTGTGVSISTTAVSDPTKTGTSNAFNVETPAPSLDRFTFDTISSPKTAGTAFSITIRAIDQFGNAFTGYTGNPTLTYSAGSISPTSSGAFTAGVRTVSVTVYNSGTSVSITATDGSTTGTSNTFNVNPGSGTFGNNGSPGTSSQDTEDRITGGQFVCPQSGTAQSVSAYIIVGSTRNLKAAIYTTTGSLVGSTEQKSVGTTTDGWVTFNFLSGSKPSLTSGTTYVLVVWSDDVSGGGADLYYSSSGGTGRYDNQNYGSWPNPASFVSDGNRNYLIYCTYSIP